MTSFSQKYHTSKVKRSQHLVNVRNTRSVIIMRAEEYSNRQPSSFFHGRLVKQHDIDYSRAKNLQDKWKADAKMIKGIDNLPGRKTMTERVVKKIIQAKKRLRL